MTEQIPDNELRFSRTFDAPRELVFAAWTQPQHVALWWGPDGFTNTIHEMTVKAGGVFRFTMHGPDGTDYPNRIVYREVNAPERLVYGHGDDEGEHFHVTVEFFAEPGGKTRLEACMRFPSAEACRKTREFGAVEGARQTMARLAHYLATLRETP